MEVVCNESNPDEVIILLLLFNEISLISIYNLRKNTNEKYDDDWWIWETIYAGIPTDWYEFSEGIQRVWWLFSLSVQIVWWVFYLR